MSTRQIEGVAVRLPAQVRHDINPTDVVPAGSPAVRRRGLHRNMTTATGRHGTKGAT